MSGANSITLSKLAHYSTTLPLINGTLHIIMKEYRPNHHAVMNSKVAGKALKDALASLEESMQPINSDLRAILSKGIIPTEYRTHYDRTIGSLTSLLKNLKDLKEDISQYESKLKYNQRTDNKNLSLASKTKGYNF